MGQVHDQRGRVESDQHIGRITRRGDPVAAKLYLESAHPITGAGRRPNLCRKVGHGGQIVPSHGAGHGELLALELDTIAGVAREADNIAGFGGGCLLH